MRVHCPQEVLTGAHEVCWGGREHELVSHGLGVCTTSDARLHHLVILDELGQPGHGAVAVEGVVAQGPGGKGRVKLVAHFHIRLETNRQVSRLPHFLADSKSFVSSTFLKLFSKLILCLL